MRRAFDRSTAAGDTAGWAWQRTAGRVAGAITVCVVGGAVVSGCFLYGPGDRGGEDPPPADPGPAASVALARCELLTISPTCTDVEGAAGRHEATLGSGRILHLAPDGGPLPDATGPVDATGPADGRGDALADTADTADSTADALDAGGADAAADAMTGDAGDAATPVDTSAPEDTAPPRPPAPPPVPPVPAATACAAVSAARLSCPQGAGDVDVAPLGNQRAALLGRTGEVVVVGAGGAASAQAGQEISRIDSAYRRGESGFSGSRLFVEPDDSVSYLDETYDGLFLRRAGSEEKETLLEAGSPHVSRFFRVQPGKVLFQVFSNEGRSLIERSTSATTTSADAVAGVLLLGPEGEQVHYAQEGFDSTLTFHEPDEQIRFPGSGLEGLAVELGPLGPVVAQASTTRLAVGFEGSERASYDLELSRGTPCEISCPDCGPNECRGSCDAEVDQYPQGAVLLRRDDEGVVWLAYLVASSQLVRQLTYDDGGDGNILCSIFTLGFEDCSSEASCRVSDSLTVTRLQLVVARVDAAAGAVDERLRVTLDPQLATSWASTSASFSSEIRSPLFGDLRGQLLHLGVQSSTGLDYLAVDLSALD